MLWGLLPSEIPATPFENWLPASGDTFLVDTEANVGYLLHADEGGYTSFPVATGQHRVVRYIGRVYNATTPVATWKVLSKDIKGDRITFGKLGRFLRLSMEGSEGLESTSYGIHSHAYASKMLASTDRYRSMGCIIVSDDVLDRIIETYTFNADTLNVKTVAGLGDDSISYEVLKEKMTSL